MSSPGNRAADRTETIITAHLWPALQEVHTKAREAAAALHRYSPDRLGPPGTRGDKVPQTTRRAPTRGTWTRMSA